MRPHTWVQVIAKGEFQNCIGQITGKVAKDTYMVAINGNNMPFHEDDLAEISSAAPMRWGIVPTLLNAAV